MSLALTALLGPSRLHAQYQQPWVGGGIDSRQVTGQDQVLVAQGSAISVPAARRQPSVVAPTKFTIRIENISRGEVLKLSDGKSAPFVSAPVLWVIHYGTSKPLFTGGKPDAGKGLEVLAETGNPTGLIKSLSGRSGIIAAGADAKPVDASAEGPITPGQSYEFEIEAQPGQTLSTAWMFGQSNDLFYSNERPIMLFDAAGKPVSGDMTAQLLLWDAGTEVNEEPGLGPNQGPRQTTPDAGVVEHEGIDHVHDRYTYPRTADVLRMTITPTKDALSKMSQM
jgi:hypothetical protein